MDSLKSGGYIECVPIKQSVVSEKPFHKRGETYGGIRETSAADPAPGEVGFFIVSSTRVHSSPLKPHWP